MQFAIQILIENSFAYTPEKGSIYIKIFKEDSHVTMSIKDSGMGISKEDLPRMFTKFFRSHDAKTVDTEGMGIGLFMAKEIIERHGGNVSVKSEGLGKGSEFSIHLPFVK